jgi:cation diffusion facilitator CzcD-associated flavoprotein CzcO
LEVFFPGFTDYSVRQTVIDRADFVVTGTGLLDKWDWPQIEGLQDFKGQLVHTANWDHSIKLHKDLNVALVGAGSSGIQVLPTVQPIVAHVDHYMKGRNWISPFAFGGSEIERRGYTGGNCEYFLSSYLPHEDSVPC